VEDLQRNLNEAIWKHKVVLLTLAYYIVLMLMPPPPPPPPPPFFLLPLFQELEDMNDPDRLKDLYKDAGWRTVAVLSTRNHGLFF
jgi:hypothetical protein